MMNGLVAPSVYEWGAQQCPVNKHPPVHSRTLPHPEQHFVAYCRGANMLHGLLA